MKILLLLLTTFFSSTLTSQPTIDLQLAIKQGDYEKFKAAIAAGADVNAYDATGNTPLLNAIAYPQMVRELIAAKADVNKFNSTKLFSPLLSACGQAHLGILQDLIAAGANVNGVDALVGISPLFYAFNSAMPMEGIKLLLSKGADPKHKTLAGNNLIEFFAAGAFSPQVKITKANEVVTYYKSVGTAIPPLYADPSILSNQPLSGLEERLDLILSFGLTIDQESPYVAPASTPNAAEINKINAKYGLKIWPLYLAMNNYGGRVDMARLLISRGANPNKLFGGGSFGLNRTILHALALQGEKINPTDKSDLVKVLVEGGIDINKTDGPGFTALMYGAQNGNTSFIRALLPHQPDLNVKQKETSRESWSSFSSTYTSVTKTWRTALDWAADSKQTEGYNLIKNAGGKGASEVR